ncbi:hypothetical protein M413DRAFT_373739 [Hebeloma cylindrosporum]|uniref:Uncharacterized protein n=1 Tax=Hebeloma cylindrosporum TaxID=76867 RepID=A0A0C2Y2H3_HEBCY|nr:hypothetical protein M413DRAFT_373739 [Hebeloma cylindrosporum h7]
MQHLLLSNALGGKGVSEPFKEKLRIQNIVETICPRLCQAKMILREIIGSLTPGRCCKKMTQALAERAVEVTSNISHSLEGVEETPQLLENIFQLEETLRAIYVFVQSETQRNLFLRMLFAKYLRARYFSLDRQLEGLLKPFKQTVKKRLVLCAEALSTTLQEGHSDVVRFSFVMMFYS